MKRTRDWRRDQKARRKTEAHKLYEEMRAEHEATWLYGSNPFLNNLDNDQGTILIRYEEYYNEAYWNRRLHDQMRDEGRHSWQRRHRNRRCPEWRSRSPCDWCIGGRYAKLIRKGEAMDEELRCYIMGELFCEEEKWVRAQVMRVVPTSIGYK